MKKKIYVPIIAALVAVVAFYNIDSFKEKAKLSGLMLDNVEALAGGEAPNGGQCPEPYDVYNHHFSYAQRTGTFTLDADLCITVMGKRIKILGGDLKAGMSIDATYEIGNCDTESPGNCCPFSKIGSVINIVTQKKV